MLMAITATVLYDTAAPVDMMAWVHEINKRIAVLGYMDAVFGQVSELR